MKPPPRGKEPPGNSTPEFWRPAAPARRLLPDDQAASQRQPGPAGRRLAGGRVYRAARSAAWRRGWHSENVVERRRWHGVEVDRRVLQPHVGWCSRDTPGVITSSQEFQEESLRLCRGVRAKFVGQQLSKAMEGSNRVRLVPAGDVRAN